MKNIFITLDIQHGELEHTHKVVTRTSAKNINFAAERYASKYWGDSYLSDGRWYAQGGEIAIRMSDVKLISDEDLRVLTKYL